MIPFRLIPAICLTLGWLGADGRQSLGQDFPPIRNSEQNQAQPMPADVAAKSMRLPPGFQLSVFASEPEVQNPIAMTFDPRGRLWIAENYTYAERTQRFDLSMRDRVLWFEDTDQDGIVDRREVFLDNVQMLTSVEVGQGGVYLMCPRCFCLYQTPTTMVKPMAPRKWYWMDLKSLETTTTTLPTASNGAPMDGSTVAVDTRVRDSSESPTPKLKSVFLSMEASGVSTQRGMCSKHSAMGQPTHGATTGTKTERTVLLSIP